MIDSMPETTRIYPRAAYRQYGQSILHGNKNSREEVLGKKTWKRVGYLGCRSFPCLKRKVSSGKQLSFRFQDPSLENKSTPWKTYARGTLDFEDPEDGTPALKAWITLSSNSRR
ncbi:hypothetical protein ABW19_dt0205049 [Dactylella cylindrospora]|nr:hypothetical protein ABW19_dt0205049 [Dactylella cylindrospora]